MSSDREYLFNISSKEHKKQNIVEKQIDVIHIGSSNEILDSSKISKLNFSILNHKNTTKNDRGNY